MTEELALIEIGTIVSPHGIKGEVKVYTDSDFPERFKTPGKRLLKRPNQNRYEWVTLKRGYYLPGKGLYVVSFEEVQDRNEAEALRKSKLFVEKRDRPTLEENEYHFDDLLNLAVIDQETSEKIGHVVDIYVAGNELLVVKLDKVFLEKHFSKQFPPKHQVLIPFVQNIVPIIDLENGKLELKLPPGLLELNAS